jgi:hypothetical protein
MVGMYRVLRRMEGRGQASVYSRPSRMGVAWAREIIFTRLGPICAGWFRPRSCRKALGSKQSSSSRRESDDTNRQSEKSSYSTRVHRVRAPEDSRGVSLLHREAKQGHETSRLGDLDWSVVCALRADWTWRRRRVPQGCGRRWGGAESGDRAHAGVAANTLEYSPKNELVEARAYPAFRTAYRVGGRGRPSSQAGARVDVRIDDKHASPQDG